MNLPAIVEATLEGLGTLLHIGTTSYDNTKTAEDVLYKPCFWTVRKKGKEYDGSPRKERDDEYVTYIEAVQERNVLLTKYAKDDNDVDITDPLDKDFKMSVGCVREINTDQAEKWFEEAESKGGKSWKKIIIDCYFTHSDDGRKKVMGFIERIFDKESTSVRKAKQAIFTAKRDNYQQLMEDPSSEESKLLAQELLEKVAKGTITHKEACMEAMDN
jgi:hypothetical protein